MAVNAIVEIYTNLHLLLKQTSVGLETIASYKREEQRRPNLLAAISDWIFDMQPPTDPTVPAFVDQPKSEWKARRKEL